MRGNARGTGLAADRGAIIADGVRGAVRGVAVVLGRGAVKNGTAPRLAARPVRGTAIAIGTPKSLGDDIVRTPDRGVERGRTSTNRQRARNRPVDGRKLVTVVHASVISSKRTISG